MHTESRLTSCLLLKYSIYCWGMAVHAFLPSRDVCISEASLGYTASPRKAREPCLEKKQINNSICFKISVSNCFLTACVQCMVSIVLSAPSCTVLVPISQMKTVCLTDSESKTEMME